MLINIEAIRKFILNNKLICSLVAVAVLAHYVTLFVCAENVPVGDDYYDIFRFLSQYDNAHSIKEKLFTIYMQHFEHRTAFNRLIYLIVYESTGSINFKSLMLIGDLSTFGLIALLSAQYKNRQDFSIIFAFTAIFLLNLQGWSSMLWAMTAISNYSVALFVFACLTALASSNTLGIYFAILFAALASLSMGNGLIAWPLGLLFIIFVEHERRNFRFVLWSFTAVFFVVIYFYHYTFLSSMRAPLKLGLVANQWSSSAQWFLSFLGSCWTFESDNTTVAMVAGMILLLSAIPCFFFLVKRTPVIAYFIVFIIFSAVIAAYSRFSSGLHEALTSRYKIYSIYVSCIILTALFIWLSEKKIKPRLLSILLLTVALGHTVATYLTSFDPLKVEHNDIADSMRRWLLTGQLSRFDVVIMPDSRTWIEDAILSKRWDPRSLFSDSLYFRRARDLQDCSSSEYSGDIVALMTRNQAAIVGEIVVDDSPLIFDHIQYILACHGQRVYEAKGITPSRSIEGRLVFHYLKTDPLEDAGTLVFKTRMGGTYRGVLQSR